MGKNIRDITRDVKKIFSAVVFIGTLGLSGYFVYSMIDNYTKIQHVKNALDTNKDNELSQDEIKRFYDKVGTTPYTLDNLRNAPTEDLNKFLKGYNEYNPRK